MFLDALLQLSAAQQVTADAASGNTFDAGNVTPKRKLGVGEPVGIGVFIKAIGTNTGSAKFQAIMSAASNLGTPTIVGEVDLATADIAVGKAYFIALPAGGPSALRYWGAYYDITGTVDFTVDAFLMPKSMFMERAEKYAKGYTIS